MWIPAEVDFQHARATDDDTFLFPGPSAGRQKRGTGDGPRRSGSRPSNQSPSGRSLIAECRALIASKGEEEGAVYGLTYRITGACRRPSLGVGLMRDGAISVWSGDLEGGGGVRCSIIVGRFGGYQKAVGIYWYSYGCSRRGGAGAYIR